LAITRVRVVPVSLAGRRRIENLVGRYLAEIRAKKMATSLARELYGMLIGDIPGMPQISKLIVIPDGKLHLLPFAGLQDARGRYTIETHSISSAPSGTVLHLLRNS